MKTTKSVCVFILGFILTTAASATEEKVTQSDEQTLLCSPEKDANCNKAVEHSPSHPNGKDWTHTRLEQVAAVLPQPTANKSKMDRPSKVTLESPKFLTVFSGSEAKLEWTKSDNAKVYHLQVSKDAGFNNRSMYVVNENALTDTTFEVKNLEPDTKYFWRVAAFNNELKEGYTKSNFTSSAFSTK